MERLTRIFVSKIKYGLWNREILTEYHVTAEFLPYYIEIRITINGEVL